MSDTLDLPTRELAERPGIDLRRVGSSPDHWYPLAWPKDLKPGKTYVDDRGSMFPVRHREPVADHQVTYERP